MHKDLELVARSDANILLTGETGTGKSYHARVIHDLSPRRASPYVRVSCGGLSGDLIRSELFGHVRGAFTGADRDHAGKFSVVQDGTILLDEIDCVPLDAQGSLLRVLDDRVYEPVGSRTTEQFRGRVIAATNRPLEKLVASRKFRSDLYFRLNAFQFTLPPLRDLPDTVRSLAKSFLEDACTREGRLITGITAEALRALLAYWWPGNIRELRNTIERAVILCRGEVLDVSELPDVIRRTATLIKSNIASTEAALVLPQNELVNIRQRATRERVVQALVSHGNNRTRAAKALGISRNGLYGHIRRYAIGVAAEAELDSIS